MKRLHFGCAFALLGSAFGLLAAGSPALAQSTPTRAKTAPSAVDVEAAKRATAQLYAAQPPIVYPPSYTVMSAAEQAAARQARPSPLLPSPNPNANPSPSANGLVTAAPLGPQSGQGASRWVPNAPAQQAAAPTQQPPVARAAAEVWQGLYECASAEKVVLRPGPGTAQVELQWGKQRWHLQRTDSRSGALRLEDAGARMVWIQLPNKSMLLDQSLGRRLLDECQHAEQVQTAAHMKNNPPPALFDTRGMGR